MTVLSDGSLTDSDRSVLSGHIKGIRILDALPEATGAICAALGTDERKNHIFIRKLVDLPLQSRAPYVLFFDSDVVFRRPIPPSFFDLNGKGVLYNKDHDHSRYDTSFHHVLEYVATLGSKATAVTNLNSGLMLWDRKALLSSDLLAYPRFVKQKNGSLYYLIEQDSFCALASAVPAAPMPIEYLVLCNWEDSNPETRKNAISIHYVGGERYKSFGYRNDGLAVLRQLRAKN